MVTRAVHFKIIGGLFLFGLLASAALTIAAEGDGSGDMSKLDVWVRPPDIEFFHTTVNAMSNNALFKGLFEDEMAEVAGSFGGIEDIHAGNWQIPIIVGSVVYRNMCKIELVFAPGLSSVEKVSLQSAVQEWIAVRWYTRYVEPNGIMCIPEDPFCPPWPGYIIGELLVGFNNAAKEFGVVEATIHNDGQRDANLVYVRFSACGADTDDCVQMGRDKKIARVYAGGTAVVRAVSDGDEGEMFCVTVDPYDTIAESSEYNNQACMHEARTVYVDDDFSDDASNHRWSTIQKGIDDAGDGDTVIVYGGLYAEDINFLGKNITLTSADAPRSTTIEGIVRFRGTEDERCVLRGFNIDGSIVGFDDEIDPYGDNHTGATISGCALADIVTDCGGVIQACDGMIGNCLIADIDYMCLRPSPVPAIVGCHGVIKNCTMVNMRDGIQVDEGQSLAIENSIMYGSSPLNASWGAVINVSHCNTDMGVEGVLGEGTVNWGPGNIFAEPCLADIDKGDYHLKSQGGRWNPDSQTWILDEITSPCIDAGDVSRPVGPEAFPNGGVVNMGAYGGTTEASKSYFGAELCQTIMAGDINGDCIVNLADLAILSHHWLKDNRGI